MPPSPSYAPIPRSSPSRPIRALPCPTPIEKMVKRATELGGLEAVIGAAEAGHSPDSPLSVAIKVSIVSTGGHHRLARRQSPHQGRPRTDPERPHFHRRRRGVDSARA